MGLLLYFAVSYDNNNAVIVRPSITWRFPLSVELDP